MSDSPLLSHAKDLEIRTSFASQGFMRLIGAALLELAYGRCVLELPFSAAVAQQQGFFHGAVIGAVADVAAGYAAQTVMAEGNEVVTLEYKINFLRPAVGERLISEGSVLRAGRSVVVTRGDVYVESAGRKLLCAAIQQSIVPSPVKTPA